MARPLIQVVAHSFIHVSPKQGTTPGRTDSSDARLGLFGNKARRALTHALWIPVHVHTHTLARTTARLTASLGSTKATAHATHAAHTRPAELRTLTSFTRFALTGSNARLGPGGIHQLAGSAWFVRARVGFEHVAGARGETQADVGRYVGAAVVVGQAYHERAKATGPGVARRPVGTAAEPAARPIGAEVTRRALGGNRPRRTRVAIASGGRLDTSRYDFLRLQVGGGQAGLTSVATLARLVVTGAYRAQRGAVRRIVDAATAVFNDRRALVVVSARIGVVGAASCAQQRDQS